MTERITLTARVRVDGQDQSTCVCHHQTCNELRLLNCVANRHFDLCTTLPISTFQSRAYSILVLIPSIYLMTSASMSLYEQTSDENTLYGPLT
jgi:hypothetical protein